MPADQKPIECLMFCIFMAKSFYVMFPGSVLYFVFRMPEFMPVWFWVGASLAFLCILMELISNYQLYLHHINQRFREKRIEEQDPEEAQLLKGKTTT
jgi:hypothetical protein